MQLRAGALRQVSGGGRGKGRFLRTVGSYKDLCRQFNRFPARYQNRSVSMVDHRVRDAARKASPYRPKATAAHYDQPGTYLLRPVYDLGVRSPHSKVRASHLG